MHSIETPYGGGFSRLSEPTSFLGSASMTWDGGFVLGVHDVQETFNGGDKSGYAELSGGDVVLCPALMCGVTVG